MSDETEIQALLEGIAAELDAPVTLADTNERLLAHTAHDGEIDEIRRQALLQRRIAPELRAWFDQWGIRESEQPIRTPGDAKIGALPRWCIPVRFRRTHLGSIWILDSGHVPKEALGSAIEAAEQIGFALYRRRVSTELEADLLRLLLVADPEQEGLAAEARALSNYPRSGHVAVVVAGSASTTVLSPEETSDLSVAVRRAVEQSGSDSVLGAVISGVAVLLAPLRKRDDSSPAHRLAENVQRLVTHVNSDLQLVAGIGSSTELERASHSYAEARRALRMARAIPELGPVAAWDQLGVFRALALLPTNELESGVLDTRVRGLLEDELLAKTAEVFLDLAGNIQDTAAQLHLHRTTLYQRLDRIAALYHLDLRRSGDSRLITHLGLKLAKIAASTTG